MLLVPLPKYPGPSIASKYPDPSIAWLFWKPKLLGNTGFTSPFHWSFRVPKGDLIRAHCFDHVPFERVQVSDTTLGASNSNSCSRCASAASPPASSGRQHLSLYRVFLWWEFQWRRNSWEPRILLVGSVAYMLPKLAIYIYIYLVYKWYMYIYYLYCQLGDYMYIYMTVFRKACSQNRPNNAFPCVTPLLVIKKHTLSDNHRICKQKH